MKKLGKYYYADAGKHIVMTVAGLEQREVRKAFDELDKPEDGLGKVPVSWVTHGWVVEVDR